MTAEPTIDYEALAQDAMRGVVRTVLAQAAKSGLSGDHHFYISFDTAAPGVALSRRLKEKYPNEMTIVLQHRFWDLAVADDRFEVKLTFDGIPERLVVPFAAIKVFFDPSVRYGLQFEDPGLGPDTSAHTQAANALESVSRSGTGRGSQPRKSSRPVRKARTDHSGLDAPSHQIASSATAQGAPPANSSRPTPAGAPIAANSATKDAPATDSTPSKPEKAPGGAEIVRLDKFRKK